MTVITLYALLAFVAIIFNEIYSLWVILPPSDGGCGFSTSETGLNLAIVGFTLVIFQVFLYHRIVARIGNLRTFQLGTFLCGVSFALMPFSSLAASPEKKGVNYLLWTCLSLIGLLKTWAGGAAFSSAFILVGNSTVSSKTGAVNGLAQMVSALARALGPTVGGSIFAWSNSNKLPFPLDFHLVFLLVGILSVGIVLISLVLPKNVDQRK